MTITISHTPQSRRESAPHMLAITALALLARLLILAFVIVHFPPSWLYSRGIELGTLAHSLRTGRGLSSPFGGSTGPTALLGPGYPAIIAAFFDVFGSFSFQAAVAIMAMQIVFSVMTVWMIMHIARRCFDSRVANLAGAFWALSLPIVWMPTIFWETCLSTLLLVGMIALVLRCNRRPTYALWAGIGAYSGFAALVNPALLIALIAMMAWVSCTTRRHSLYLPALGFVMLALVFAPWPLRNARELHAFIPLRSTVGFELWMGNRAGATGFLDESQFPLFNKVEYESYVSKGEVVYMQDKSALAVTYIHTHPVEFMELSGIRLLRFWSGMGNRDSSPVFAIHALLTSSLGFIGIWRLVRKRRAGLALLFSLPLILYPLPYYITHAEFRYRLVIDPLLTILAAYTLSDWRHRRGEDVEGRLSQVRVQTRG